MTRRALRPLQLVGVPDNVSTKVSQFTPSTQVLSSSDPPPTAVPTQFTAGPPGLSVPELGIADCNRAVKSPNTNRKIPATKEKRADSGARGNRMRGNLFHRQHSIKSA